MQWPLDEGPVHILQFSVLPLHDILVGLLSPMLSVPVLIMSLKSNLSLALSTRMSSNPTASSEPLLELTYTNHLLKSLDIWLDPTDLIRNILKYFMLGYIEANHREMDTSIWTSHREMFKRDSERAKHD